MALPGDSTSTPEYLDPTWAVAVSRYLKRLADRVKADGQYREGHTKRHGDDAARLAGLLRSGAWALDDLLSPADRL